MREYSCEFVGVRNLQFSGYEIDVPLGVPGRERAKTWYVSISNGSAPMMYTF